MNILITNDDGIQAEGIRELVKCLGTEHRIFVAAPMHVQSGASHAASYYRTDIRAAPVRMEGAVRAWSIDGTPADCVYTARYGLLDDPIDLLISGINLGWNVSSDIQYSGTVAAAFEGRLRGWPSMAVSSSSSRPTEQALLAAAETARHLVNWYVEQDFANWAVLNVNVPAVAFEEIKGFVSAPCQTEELYMHSHKKEETENGELIFQFRNTVRTMAAGVLGDAAAVQAGYISLTALKADWTDNEGMIALKTWENRS